MHFANPPVVSLESKNPALAGFFMFRLVAFIR